MNIEIIIGRGLDKLSFGMSRKEVEQFLGSPSEKEEITYDDDPKLKTEVWHYDDEKISFAFDNTDDYILTSIATTAPNAKLKGIQLIGLDYDELIEVLEDLGVDDYEEEDWDPMGSETYTLFSDSTGLSFWMENNLLKEIEWAEVDEDTDFMIWTIGDEEE